MTTFVHSFCSRHVLCIDASEFETIGDLKAHLSETKGFPLTASFFVCGGNIVEDDEPVLQGLVYHTFPRILGGKGGFGSMLRAIGAQIEKTTNREALRDLSGRRMRDVNNEKSLKEWISKQADREKEREEKRQERIARRRAMPNHKFDDPEYDKQKSTLAENQDDAFQTGLKKVQQGASATMTYEESVRASAKRKSEMAGPGTSKVRKETEWLGIDIDDLDSDDSGGTDDSPGPDIAGDDTPIPDMAEPGDDSPPGDDTSTEGLTVPGDGAQAAITHTAPGDDSSSSSHSDTEQVKQHTEDIREHAVVETPGTSIDTPQDSDCKCGNENTETSVGKRSRDDKSTTLSDKVVLSLDSETSEKVAVVSSDQGISTTDDISDTVKKTTAETSDRIVCSIKTAVDREDTVTIKEESIKKEEPVGEAMDVDKDAGHPDNSNAVAVEQMGIKQEPFNLDSAESLAELLALGLEMLKSELMSRGLKCGGTLEQRAERLYSVRGLKPEEIDQSLFAKSSGKRGKKNKN